MLKVLSAALLVSVAFPISAQAFTPLHREYETWFPRGIVTPPPTTCLQPQDNGCANADQNASYQPANILNTAQQDGQNSLLPLHSVVANGIVPQNMPAADYPVGPNKNLTPQDPRTLNTANVKYDSVNNYVAIFPTSNGQVANIVLDNYDYGGTKIGQTPLNVYMGGCGAGCNFGAGSTFTFTNSYFAIKAGASGSPLGWGSGTTGQFNVVYKNNQCDGTSATSASSFCLQDDFDAAGTSIDIEYSAFTNQGVGRITGGPKSSAYIVKYNFIQGLNDLATSNHGELMIRNCTGTRKNCTAYDDYEGNFIVWNPPSTSGLNNATIFPGDGASDGVSLTSVTFNDNVVVTNKNGSAQNVIDQAVMNARVATLGVVNMNRNWVSANGANGCSINGVKSGGNSVTASQSGNVVTITGLSSSFGNNPIEPKWQLWRGGILWATITALGTSVGNTGTVNVDVSATVPSDSAWTLVPGFTSLTANDNYNLNDPAHTGVAAAMNISGPQMTAATCKT